MDCCRDRRRSWAARRPRGFNVALTELESGEPTTQRAVAILNAIRPMDAGEPDVQSFTHRLALAQISRWRTTHLTTIAQLASLGRTPELVMAQHAAAELVRRGLIASVRAGGRASASEVDGLTNRVMTHELRARQ
jgi:hypothetical protein